MSVRLHTTPVYMIEYGDTISSKFTDTIINIIKNSETGWVNEDELEMEIDFIELDEIITNCEDKELKTVLQKIIDQSDRHNDFIHLSLF